MDKSAREPFERMAKDGKESGKLRTSDGGILTSQGLSVSDLNKEREKAQMKLTEMKQRIHQFVDDAFLSNSKRFCSMQCRTKQLVKYNCACCFFF